MTRSICHSLLVGFCIGLLAPSAVHAETDLLESIRLSLDSTGSTDTRAAAIGHVLSSSDAVDNLVISLRRSERARERAKLAALLGAAADVDTLSRLLVQPGLAGTGSLEREILGSAFLETLFSAFDDGKPPEPATAAPGPDDVRAARRSAVLAVVDAFYADPNWRIRQIAARLLRAIDAMEPSVVLQALSRDAAWPVRTHAIPTPPPRPMKDSPKPKPPMAAPSVAADAALALSAIDSLYGFAALADRISAETIAYRARAKWGFVRLPSGTMKSAITRERRHGVPVYHLQQRIAVAGRYQDEDAYIDAVGLFPCEYSVAMRRPTGGRWRHVVLWDHVGRRIHLSKTKINGETRHESWEMGEDEPFDSRDPLSAMLIYRLSHTSATPVDNWSANVLMSCDERYRVNVDGTSASTAKADIVSWQWIARDCDEANRTVKSWFGPVPDAIPVKYTTRAWGIKGSATLTSYTTEATNAVSVAGEGKR
jgi:hypothetical protein